MTLRLYDLGDKGFVAPPVLEALGGAVNLRHVNVYIVAGSRRAAAMLYNATRVGLLIRTEDVAAHAGHDDFHAILAAGFAEHPGVFITDTQGGNDRLVLRATGNGQVQTAGYLHCEPGGRVSLIDSAPEADTLT